MESEATPEFIMDIGHAFRRSKALLSAVELGVFTALAGGPLAIDALKERVSINDRGARDFFDALVALGMLVRNGDGRYANSAATDLYLDRNKPTYVGGLLESFNAWQYSVWGSLTAALRTGAPQAPDGTRGHFKSLYADETTRGLFASGMTVRSRPVAAALAIKFPWADFNTLIDIGTAEGCLPVEIAGVHPHVTGGGYDLPPMGPLFDRNVQSHELSERLKFYSGDFLADPIPVADVLVMGRILHSWDLPTKKMLLRKAYDALPSGGALIVYERLIDDERRTNAAALLSSLNQLLLSPGGFDFTGAECTGWMRESGFRNLSAEPLGTEETMIVGLK